MTRTTSPTLRRRRALLASLTLLALSPLACSDDGSGDSGADTGTGQDTGDAVADTAAPDSATPDSATPDTSDEDANQPDAPDDVSVQARFELEGGFFEAPFPIASRQREDGTLRFDDFPNPEGNAFLSDYVSVADRIQTGFSRNAATFFTFTGAIDPARLPGDLDATTAPSSPVLFIDIDPDSPARGERVPVQLVWAEEGALLRPPHLLTVLPYPGVVLRPDTWYGVVLLDGLTDAAGEPLGAPDALAALLGGERVAGATDALVEGFGHLREALQGDGIGVERVVAATAFQTGDPDALARSLQQHAASLPAADALVGARIRSYNDYCVVEGQTEVPIYQTGDRPYVDPGSGEFEFVDGAPVVQWTETIRFALSLPKGRPMPEGGFPTLFYISGGGGRYTQAVDRGTFAEQDADPENGRGPAWIAALSGWATIGIEAPLVGPRHPNMAFDPFDFHNPFNLTSFRNNLLQAAVEYSALSRAVAALSFDAAALCDDIDTGDGPARFDRDSFALMGQSTGASVGEIVLATEPLFKAGILSGAGGSWIYNLAFKQQPLVVSDALELVLKLGPEEPLDPFHPLATLFQTSTEATEAMNFGRRWVEEPFEGNPRKNVLLIGGLIDGYFLPRMISALVMAAELDLAGPAHDPDLATDITRVGAAQVDLPAPPNRGDLSAHALMYVADDFDGHYVTFNLPEPKTAWRCWLESLARTGRATLPSPSADFQAPCP